MAFTTSAANAIISKLLRNTDFTHPTAVYVSLHTGNPGETGTSEVTAGANAYARQLASFTAPSTKASSNSADLIWTNMPATTITHIGIWSAATGGTFWWGGALAASKTTSAGDTFRIAAGDLDVTLT